MGFHTLHNGFTRLGHANSGSGTIEQLLTWYIHVSGFGSGKTWFSISLVLAFFFFFFFLFAAHYRIYFENFFFEVSAAPMGSALRQLLALTSNTF